MPYVWTSKDTQNAVIASLLPASIGIAGCCAFSNDASVQSFVQTFRPPSWALSNRKVYTAIDLVVISPLGYATYLVYKDGGGFDYTDTTVALSIYGLNLAGVAAVIPAFKNKNLKCIATLAIINTVTASAAAIAYSKINNKAGWLLVPYALWSGYYALIASRIYSNSVGDEPEPIQALASKTE